MPSARPGHRLLAGVAATVAVLALAAATLAWQVGGASATSAPPAAPVVEQPRTTMSTTTSTSPPFASTTSTSTSTTSTSTTVKPRSMTTTAAPRPPAPAPAPATTPPTAAPAPPGPPASASSDRPRCATALQWASARGLNLPAGWGFRCPGPAVVGGASRSGMACWNCEGAGSWIAVDIGRIGSSDAMLRHVVAHEICHARDYVGLGLSTELGADLCAALHGAPRP